MKLLVVVFVLLSAVLLSKSVLHIVTVDEVKGYDNEFCVANLGCACKTLSYAVSAIKNKVNVTIQLQSELITLDTVLYFNEWINITLEGLGKDITSIKCKYTAGHKSMGLVFNNSNGIKLQRLSVTYCSVKIHSNFSSGLVISNSSSVCLYNISITHSNGFGAMLINNKKNIIVNFSLFTNNSIKTVDTDLIQGGGGMAIVVSQCSFDSISCNDSNIVLNGNYTISNSVFYNNSQSKAKYNEMYYGGGLNIFLKWRAKNNIFKISNTTFKWNSAGDGGGMGLSIQDTATHNVILIERCKYMKNKVYEKYLGGGGGMIVSVAAKIKNAQLPKNNSITIKDTVFKRNDATYGGGTSIYIAAIDRPITSNNTLLFTNCTWIENKAAASTAVDIVPVVYEQTKPIVIVLPVFEDCNILSNHPRSLVINETHFTGKGIFLVSKVTVKFKGVNTFHNNSMTPLFLFNSVIQIESNSKMIFENNKGLRGGALKLEGFSAIVYDNNVTFNFINNSADLVGGAIYVLNGDPHYSFASHLCFFQNRTNSNNVFFKFINNHSPPPSNTIYVTSLHACAYFCNKTIFSSKNLFSSNTSSCLGRFYFQSKDKVHYDIMTDASNILLTRRNITAIPGHSTFVPVEFYDDIEQNVTNTTYFTAKVSKSSAKLNLSPLTSYNNHITLLGTPGSNGLLTIIPLGVVDHTCSSQLHFSLSSCPPGYVLVNNRCQCSLSANSSNWYSGILNCDDKDLSIHISPGHWIGYNNDIAEDFNEDRLCTGMCPLGYCTTYNGGNKLNGRYVEIKPGSDLSEQICVGNRQGTLCGQCTPGTSVAFHSESFQCKSDADCHLGMLFYILSELVPIVVLFAIILYFNISFTNGAAYSIVFAIQHTEVLQIAVRGSIPYKCMWCIEVVRTIYNIFNLKFFTFDQLSFCLWKNTNTLDILAIKYVSIVFAVSLILILVYCMSRCCLRCCQRSGSMVHGLTAFLIICYSQCTSLTVSILTPVTLHGKGQLPCYNRTLVYFEGGIKYFDSKHIYYAIPAVLCLCLIIIPVPLILFCDPFLLKLEGRLKMCQFWTRCREPFKPLLDSFQGCFKDHMRCFAGFFFLYRDSIFLALLISTNLNEYYYNIEIILILIFAVQSVFQPFHETSHNVIASLSICNLILINLLTVKIITTVDIKGLTHYVSLMQYVQLFLLSLPLLIGIAWIMKKVIYHFIKKKCGHMLTYNYCCYDGDDDDVNISLIYDRSTVQYQSIEIDEH